MTDARLLFCCVQRPRWDKYGQIWTDAVASCLQAGGIGEETNIAAAHLLKKCGVSLVQPTGFIWDNSTQTLASSEFSLSSLCENHVLE